MFEFSQELLAHSPRCAANFPWFPVCQDGLLLDLEKLIFEGQPVFLHPASFQSYTQSDPAQQIPELGWCLLLWCVHEYTDTSGVSYDHVDFPERLWVPYLSCWPFSIHLFLCIWRWSPFSPALMIMGSFCSYHPAGFGGQPGSSYFLAWLSVVISLPGWLADWHRCCCLTLTILVVKMRIDCRIAEGFCKTKWDGDKMADKLGIA